MQERVDKKGKTLKNLLLYTFPIAVASLLPMKDANAQTEKAFYFTHQPENFGFGVRGDLMIPHFEIANRQILPLGIYASLSKGKYLPLFGGHLKETRVAFGGLVEMGYDPFTGFCGFLSGGVTYNLYGENTCEPEMLNKRALEKFSFELGAGLKMRNFKTAFRFNPRKGNAAIDMGLTFPLSKPIFQKNRRQF